MKPPATPFVCRCCGACCRAVGYVRLTRDEPDAIAAALGLDVEDFIARFTRLTHDRQALALTERADGACIFLDAQNHCRIQHVKPKQCRDYPHRWRSATLDAVCAAQRDVGCRQT